MKIKTTLIYFIIYLQIVISMKYNIIKSHQTLYDQYAIEPVFYFTPFRIEDAQSASLSSLITARKAGVLNKKRCNKREGVLGTALYLTDMETIDSMKGFDDRFPRSNIDENILLQSGEGDADCASSMRNGVIEIIKNNERLRKIQYLESLTGSPDEYKVQAIKDLSEESDIRPFSIINGGLYNNWELDGDFHN